MVDPVALTVRERDGGAVRERNVVAFCVRFSGESFSDEVLLEELFVRPVPVNVQLVNGFVVVHGYRFPSVLVCMC